MRRLALTSAWLATGHVVAGAAYLAFINTPESNVLMITQSVALLAMGVGALLLTSAAAVVGLHLRQPAWRGVTAVPRLIPTVVFATVVVGLLCAGAGWFDRWWMSRSGEVDAALIAAADVTGTGWLHAAVHGVVVFVQWVVVPVWLATSLAWAAAYGPREVLSLKWLVAGLRPRLIAVTLLAILLLVWTPWLVVYWRPQTLSAGTLEMAFTGIKLLVIFLLANLAWALVLDEATRPTRA